MPGRSDLVETIRLQGVRDARVLQAFREVDRAEYVPPDQAIHAYEDRPIHIPRDQVTTQPSLVARMVESLGLAGDERVLEIGSGLGFQTAILAHLADRVWTIERWEDLAETARRNLTRCGVTNVEVVVGDGSTGLPEHAPYDAVLVSAAHPEVPPPLTEQLAEGGTLVMPLGPGGAEDVVLFEKEDGAMIRRRTVIGASFVRLHGRHGYRD